VGGPCFRLCLHYFQERDAAAALFASAEGRALEATVSKAKTFKIGQVVSARKEEETVLLPEERAAFEVREHAQQSRVVGVLSCGVPAG